MKSKILSAGLAILTSTSAFAQDKEMLGNLMRNERSYLQAMVLDKLVTIEASPKWWERFCDPTQSGTGTPRHNLIILLGGLMSVAQNMGWGNLSELDYNSGYDGKSPLLVDMVDSWKGKLSLNLVLKDEPSTPEGISNAHNNLSYLVSPMSNDYYCHPRSGKFLLSVRLDNKLPKGKYTWNKPMTEFTAVLPAYSTISQGDVETMLKVGR
jgi:hypothetical protein